MTQVTAPYHQTLNPQATPFQSRSLSKMPAGLAQAFQTIQTSISQNLAPYVEKDIQQGSQPFSIRQADLTSDEVLNDLWQLSHVVGNTLRPILQLDRNFPSHRAKDFLEWSAQINNGVEQLLNELPVKELEILFELMSGRFCDEKLILGSISENSPSIHLLKDLAKQYCQKKYEPKAQPDPTPLAAASEQALEEAQEQPIEETPETSDLDLIEQAVESNKLDADAAFQREALQQTDQCLDAFVQKLEQCKQPRQPRIRRIESALKNLSLLELSNLVLSMENQAICHSASDGLEYLKSRSEKHRNCLELAMIVLSKWPHISKDQATVGDIMASVRVVPADRATRSAMSAEAIKDLQNMNHRLLMCADHYSELTTASIILAKQARTSANSSSTPPGTTPFFGILSSGTNNYSQALNKLGSVPVIGGALKKTYNDLLDTFGKRLDPNGCFHEQMNANFTMQHSDPLTIVANSCYQHRLLAFGESLEKHRSEISDHLVKIAAMAGVRQHGNMIAAQPNIVSHLGLRRSPSNFILFHLLNGLIEKLQTPSSESNASPEANSPPPKTEP